MNEDLDRRNGRVLVPRQRLAELQDDPVFVALLQVGRIVNCLRFAHMAPWGVHEEEGPNRLRQMNNGFLVAVAYVSEALEALGRLGKVLKDLPSWQTDVVPLLRDKRASQLRGASINEVRNQLVFHFDDAPFVEGIRDIDLPELVLVAARGSERKDVYHPLADEVVIRRIVPDTGLSREEHFNTLREWIEVTTDVSLELSDALEAVIVDGAKRIGLKGMWDE